MIRRQDFESRVVNANDSGFQRAHLETILEVVGKDALVMMEVQDGFGHTGRLHGVSTSLHSGYATVGLTSLYEGATPTYYLGFKVRQIVVLDDHTVHHKVISRWMDMKRDALDAVRATLESEDAWAGSWTMTPHGYGDVHVSRQRHQEKYRARDDRWMVSREGRVDVIHYGGPLARDEYHTKHEGANA